MTEVQAAEVIDLLGRISWTILSLAVTLFSLAVTLFAVLEATTVSILGTHYSTESVRVVRHPWTCLHVTFPTRTEALARERLILLAHRSLSGYTRVLPAANQRWGIEVRSDMWNERKS